MQCAEDSGEFAVQQKILTADYLELFSKHSVMAIVPGWGLRVLM